MAHTLNEQTFVIGNKSTAEEVVQEFLEKASAALGWTADYDNATLYMTEDKKFYIKLIISSGYIYFTTYGNNFGLIIANSAYNRINYSSTTIVYYHISKQEKTKFLSIGINEMLLSWLFTKNNNDKNTLIVPDSYYKSGALVALEDVGRTYTLPTPSNHISENFDFSITNFPDYIRHGYYPELFFVISSKVSVINNLLVNFSDQTYRFVSLNRSGSLLSFAFPVE